MIKSFIWILTLFLLFLSVPSSSQAKTILVKPYLVTEAKEFVGNPHLNTVYYSINGSFEYRSGKVVLSENPDGTGNARVGERLRITSLYPGDQTYNYDGTCSFKPMPPLDITHLAIQGFNNMSFAFIKPVNTCLGETRSISRLYLVHFDDYEPGPTSFLELPWDYKSKGLSFVEAALSMTSYFDHKYPLLSTNLTESLEVQNNLINYENNPELNLPYSSHDGYDWAAQSKALRGEPVLAAASGLARFVNNCSACGNAIHIDHQNGYQTRYYHLLGEGLITNVPNSPVVVTAGQPIGKVGYTGNVLPQGTDGAHIHFMVIQDKNNDGNFEDNIPDGITDPFGWQAASDDPWETYSFSYAGADRTGAKSHYLWKNPLQKSTRTLTKAGGAFYFNNYRVNIPKDMIVHDGVLTIEPISTQSGTTNQSMLSGIRMTIHDGFGNLLTSFQKNFQLVLNFSTIDISRYKQDSISIYSNTGGGGSWGKENTVIDFTKKEATATVNHLTDFTLMGERLDSIPPETKARLNGLSEHHDMYTIPVNVELVATDEPTLNSLGVDYTLYKINDDSWTFYSEPFLLSEERAYTISFYSMDRDANSETLKSILFHISFPTPTPTPTSTPSPTPTPTLTPTTIPTNIPTPTPTQTAQPSQPRMPIVCKVYKEITYSPLLENLIERTQWKQWEKLCGKY